MNRLKELRKKQKNTQQDIADILKMSRRGYQKIENGESQIKPDKAQTLADYFEVSVGYLLGFSQDSQQIKTPDLVSISDEDIVQAGIDDFIKHTSKKAREYLESGVNNSDFNKRYYVVNENGEREELNSSYPLFEWLKNFYISFSLTPSDIQQIVSRVVLLEPTEKKAVLALLCELTDSKISQSDSTDHTI
ncbi:helix-turn-helix domain-containing protein [Streptococcus danieliae]|uniref:helix-turn-helix domain-containing protein n=1 Tax=Streptococcus danieliae TaxID=747656 RepID=UPI001F238F8E|nr:helix-turn-helix transcriptional regulator [Streptococcus danieliae]